jgi:hypothetical protein
MTATYDNLGVRFLYPENWAITDENSQQWPRTVTIQDPTGAFLSLSIHPPPIDVDETADAVLAAMREDYEEIEVSRCTDQFGPIEASGYEMQFYCADMVVEARLLLFKAGVRTFVVLYQAESHQFDRLDVVFRAICTSLCGNIEI